MKLFDDYKNKISLNSKEKGITYMVDLLSQLDKDNKIKDLLVIARINDEELGSSGLPHNIYNFTSIDTKNEATVFMRFATDILFDKMEYIAVKDFLKEYEEHCRENNKINE
jgi:hypothetical protein